MTTDQANEELAQWADDTAGLLIRAWTDPEQKVTEFRRELHEETSKLDGTIHETGDAAFRIVVPMSGGLDSTTCWRMAEHGNLPVELFYVDTRSAWSQTEKKLLADRGIDFEVIEPTAKFKTDRMVQYGRNAVILWLLAEEMQRRGWWGEIWFGGHMGPAGESPIRGGDKSHRFLLTFNQLLAGAEIDVRVSTPLAGLTKPDMLRWLMTNQYINEGYKTFSCFAPIDDRRCGGCNACFKWWAAFASLGIPVHDERWQKATGLDLWGSPPSWHDGTMTDHIFGDYPGVELAPGRMMWLRNAIENYPEVIV